MAEKMTTFELEVSEDDEEVGYVKLPGYPKDGTCKMSKSVRLHDLLGGYEGTDINLDFDENGVLVGIELLA